ncbi:742_t:CDS:2, partial [Cetraspora pellucida]
KPQQKRRPSIINKVELYNVANDILEIRANATVGQLLQYSNQRRNLAKIIRRPPNLKEANLVDSQLKQCTTAVKCYMYIGDEPVVAILDTGAAVSIITKRLADHLELRINEESKTVVVIATGARERTLGKITKVNINILNVRIPTALQVLESQKLVIRYMRKRFEVPIMHMDKRKQKEYISEESELEEIVSFISDSAPTDNDNTEKEISTEKKAYIDKKLTVEEQLNKIVKSGKVEG